LDTTPQLGGNLDLNSSDITGTGDINITGTVTATDAVLNGTGAIKVPVGTTAQRPTPAQGQIRYNTTDSSFEGYDGSAWGAIGGGSENSFIVYEYTATASQTTFSGADDNAATLSYTAGNIQVMLNGVVLDPSDYTATNGTSVVLASGAALNDVLNVYAFTSFTVADTVSASAGGTFSANVAFAANATFGDDDKAIFGAGSDLQIYHNGTDSVVDDQGTGKLVLKGNTAVEIRGTNGEDLAGFNMNGAVNLYYDNAAKLATTATGITVTGTAVATTDTDTTNTGSVTLDFGANQNFVLTLTGNVTLANPTTEQVGQSGFIVFIQDATGGRTVSLGTDYETAGGSGLTLSSAASTTDIVPYVVAASGRILLGAPQLNFS